jgi:hypothetical protein
MNFPVLLSAKPLPLPSLVKGDATEDITVGGESFWDISPDEARQAYENDIYDN